MALGGRDRMNSLSRLPFVEVDMSTQNPCLYPPRSLLRRPYWELRVLCRTIMEGGFISPRIFIPKGMWYVFSSFSCHLFLFFSILPPPPM